MGSDWIWELQVQAAAEPALRQLYALAAVRGLVPQRSDGLVNLFTNPNGDVHPVKDPQAALDAVAAGTAGGQLWTDDDVDVFVEWKAGTLTWSLDAAFCHRRPGPEANTFRQLHARLTSLWLDAAERLQADVGRILDEWSSEQVWHLDIHHTSHPAGGWPAELGWWTYLGTDRQLPAAPLPEIAVQARRLPNGALLVELLDDPAAVDPLRYQDIHTRWLTRVER
ncbi:hypothetical protein [Micromonospora endophytica]|uniref:Uncharacterized protein n=1 Tax=Micromonospora endophytica TaxID=515350 RepID=A0A2W2CNV1_9ACTN|nr:hypothetical protein [Micromonospora endophytica]PZG01172.1 hypothetical protein C1I93_00185 [Micromonospora endophytica]RIW42136.1 hypothetical protein D3H59_24065 [Micromonospora endophytica]